MDVWHGSPTYEGSASSVLRYFFGALVVLHSSFMCPSFTAAFARGGTGEEVVGVFFFVGLAVWVGR